MLWFTEKMVQSKTKLTSLLIYLFKNQLFQLNFKIILKMYFPFILKLFSAKRISSEKLKYIPPCLSSLRYKNYEFKLRITLTKYQNS